jgi:hypothetical protein
MFKKFWTLSLKNDLGSASIIGFAIFFVILGIISMIFMNTNESVELARLQAQTDNATVAAVDVLRGLATGYPCETAEEIVQGFGGTIERCHIVGFDIYIEVSQKVLGIVHRVQSHAGVGLLEIR